jgi:hypothetical protein
MAVVESEAGYIPLILNFCALVKSKEPEGNVPAVTPDAGTELAVAALPVHDPDEPETLPVTFPVREPTNAVAVTVPLTSRVVVGIFPIPILVFVVSTTITDVDPSALYSCMAVVESESGYIPLILNFCALVKSNVPLGNVPALIWDAEPMVPL